MKAMIACVLLLAPIGCIHAPEIVLVDRATALEQQAAGSYADLERKLARASLAPRPEPLTPEQLETLGIAPPSLVNDTERTDADRVDALLTQHCLGESRDGTLAYTHSACKGAVDRTQALALVDRTNGARQQLWRWMKARRPELAGQPLDEIRKAWHATHARGIVCGGWIQKRRRRLGGEEVLRRAAALLLLLAVAADARAQGDDDVVQRPERMTAGTADQLLGQLSPTGQTLYFVSNRNTTNELYRQENGASGAKLLFDEGADVTWPRLSPDGKRILYISFRDDASGRLCVRDLPDKRAALLRERRQRAAGAMDRRQAASRSSAATRLEGDLHVVVVSVGRTLHGQTLVERNLRARRCRPTAAGWSTCRSSATSSASAPASPRAPPRGSRRCGSIARACRRCRCRSICRG